MSTARVLAFDGTPVSGGAGMRVAIVQSADGSCVATNDRRLECAEVQRLIADGYVTPLSIPVDATTLDGVVIYKHRDFVFPGLVLDGDVIWHSSDDVDVAYMQTDAATSLMARYANLAVVCARAALARHDTLEATKYARRGLMVTPRLRSSDVAAQLYGVLLVAATLEGNAEPIRREIILMLDELRAKAATEAAAAGLARRIRQSVDTRLMERAVAIGTTVAPREAA